MDMKSCLEKNRLVLRRGVNSVSSNIIYYVCIFLAVYIMCCQQKIQGLFMDDLGFMRGWQVRKSTFEFICKPTAHFRPISNFVLAVGIALADAQTDYLWLWMLVMNTVTALVVFHVFQSVIKSQKLSFVGTVTVVASRFGYYVYGQYMGVMEQTATIMAVLVLYHVFKAVTTDKQVKHICFAMLFTALATFSHERYVTLAVLVILAALLTNSSLKKKGILFGASVLNLFALLGLRTLLLGGYALGGTAGTSVTETFNLIQALKFMIQGCLSLFGINMGMDYLEGFAYLNLPTYIKVYLHLFWLCVLLLILWGLFSKAVIQKWKQYFLAIAFVGGTMVGGCITFRLELRWLYTSYIGMILILLMLISEWKPKTITKGKIVPALLFVCLIVAELFYHGGYPIIYFSHPQSAYNQIYELTIQDNKNEALAGKRIAVICDFANGSSHITADELNTFYQTYATEMGYEAPYVEVYNSLLEYDLSNPADLVLSISWVKDWVNDTPQVKDITAELWLAHDLSRPAGNTIETAAQMTGFSWWEGWEERFIWTEAFASMRISTGATGTAVLSAKVKEYNLPNNLKIYWNDELIETFALESETVELTFDLPPHTEGIVRFELDSAVSPYDVGESDDRRSLGICIYEFKID